MEKWRTALLHVTKYVKANDFKDFFSTNQQKSKAYLEKLRESLQSKPKNGTSKEILETKDDNKLTTTKNLLLKLKEQGSERAGAFLKSDNLQVFKSKKKDVAIIQAYEASGDTYSVRNEYRIWSVSS
ncbi:unnamed protein product [Auanema sp. JU1783]|nr:unnamed protein product [Auanema sp. JU1783]